MSFDRASAHRKSQSRHDHNLPRNGNVLPREQLSADDVAKSLGTVLQGTFGQLKSPAKAIARLTGENERAVRNQYAGLNSPQLHKFFNACRPRLSELLRLGLIYYTGLTSKNSSGVRATIWMAG